MLLSHRPQGRMELVSDSVFVFPSVEMHTSAQRLLSESYIFLARQCYEKEKALKIPLPLLITEF